jgi:DNA-binding CsgD family transcriptional regulator/lipoate-protein ligase A
VDKPAFTASICNNLGIVAKERKQFEEAFRYYAKALMIRQQLDDSAGMAQTYNNIGDAQMLTGNYALARQTLLLAQDLSRSIGNIKSEMKAANFLTQVYEKTGDFSNALRLYKRFKVLHDSIISNEQVQNSAKLELRYIFEKQQKEAELNQQILLAAKERKALIYMVISAILLSSLVILFQLNRQQRNRIAKALLEQQRLDLESKNLTLEKQNLEMEKQQLERDLEFRNKELSTHVLYLIEKNEFIASLISKLLEYKHLQDTEMKSFTDELLTHMQANLDNKLWNEFEMRFQQVHQDFYQKLLAKFPDLSPNEIKICAFLKLNMTTKDISSITFQSIKSIQVARNRLRRKMGIDRDENLIILLQQL